MQVNLFFQKMITVTLLLILFIGLMMVPGCDRRWAPSEDEGFRLYTSWNISRGKLPYQDFYDNQMPNFHILGSVLINWFGNRVDILRKFVWYFGLLLGGIVVFLNHKTKEKPQVFFLVIILLFLTPVFKSMLSEFRPDLPAVVLGFGGIILFLIDMVSENNNKLSWYSIFGGLIFSFSVFTKPSTLYYLPGLFLVIILRYKQDHREKVFGFMFSLFIGLFVQGIFWTWITPGIWNCVIGGHQAAVQGKPVLIVVQKWFYGNWFIITGLFIHLLVDNNKVSEQLFFVGLLGLGTYLLINPNTPYARHLLFLTVCWSYPAATGYYRLTQETRYRRILILLFFFFWLIIFSNNFTFPLGYNSSVAEEADWIAKNTPPGEYVLTDYASYNFLANRPRPPKLANVSANLTAGGIITSLDIKQQLKIYEPGMIFFHLRPNPGHLANVQNIEKNLINWFANWNYQGLEIVNENWFMVFTPNKKGFPNIDVKPAKSYPLILPVFEKYKWQKLSKKLD